MTYRAKTTLAWRTRSVCGALKWAFFCYILCAHIIIFTLLTNALLNQHQHTLLTLLIQKYQCISAILFSIHVTNHVKKLYEGNFNKTFFSHYQFILRVNIIFLSSLSPWLLSFSVTTNLRVYGCDIFHHALHHGSYVSRLYRVHPVSCLHTLPQHLKIEFHVK